MTKAEKAAYKRDWYHKNKTTIAAHAKSYRAEHKTEIQAQKQAHYQAHRTEILARQAVLRPTCRADKAAYNRKPASRYRALVRTAKRRHIECVLTLPEYLALTATGKCVYCGASLPEVGYGLDRKDSRVGYSFDNCVSCCHACNTIRGNNLISYEEMFIVNALLSNLREGRL